MSISYSKLAYIHNCILIRKKKKFIIKTMHKTINFTLEKIKLHKRKYLLITITYVKQYLKIQNIK